MTSHPKQTNALKSHPSSFASPYFFRDNLYVITQRVNNESSSEPKPS